MGLNNVTFVLGQGGLGRPLPGEDYISGMVFFCADNKLPSGFSTTSRIKQLFGTPDAIAAGILNDYSDATAATGTLAVTAAGTNGDTAIISAKTPFGTIVFGTYTKVSGDANATAVGAAIAAIINADTITHGFTAVNATGTVTITAPKKYGAWMNTGSNLVLTLSVGATLAITVTQFSGGATSLQAIWYYHISEFFRIQPQGYLWVEFAAVPGSYTFTAEVAAIQTAAAGKIRQLSVYKDGAAFSSADITALNAALQAQFNGKKPLIGVYAADISGTADISTMPDLSLLTANLVVPAIGQDGNAQGAFLYTTYGKSITDMGALLGSLALAKVNEDIAWPAKFNMSDGTELDVPAFANGVKLTDASISDNLLGSLQNKAYNFLRTFVGVAGSYNNESRTAITITSDYAYAENNRTIQKAVRGIYAAIIPSLNAPIELNPDGTLQDTDVAAFEATAEGPLFDMQRNKEISNMDVTIDTTQDILSTGLLVIAVELQPVGVARNIQVNIGFKVQIA